MSKVVTSIVEDLINPILGAILGKAGGLTTATIAVGDGQIMIGNLISTFIDFVVIAAVVYIGVKKLGLDKLDKPKEA